MNKEIKTCQTCEKAWKRSGHDFKTYGNYGFPYECLMVCDGRTEYHRPEDTCPLWREK